MITQIAWVMSLGRVGEAAQSSERGALPYIIDHIFG